MKWSTIGRGLARHHRRNDPFRRSKHGDLDILMPPPYDDSDANQRQARQRVEELIGRLQPGGLDGNSRDVLNNLINAWMDQELARLDSHHDERRAVVEMLIGLAREEVARRKHRWEADYARAQLARQTLAIAYRQLTGEELDDLRSPYPRPGGDGADLPAPSVPLHSLNGHARSAPANGAHSPEGA